MLNLCKSSKKVSDPCFRSGTPGDWSEGRSKGDSERAQSIHSVNGYLHGLFIHNLPNNPQANTDNGPILTL